MDPGGSEGDREDAGQSGPAEEAKSGDLKPGVVSSEDRGSPTAAAELLCPVEEAKFGEVKPDSPKGGKLLRRKSRKPRRSESSGPRWPPNRKRVVEEATSAARGVDFKRRKANASLLSTVPCASAFRPFVGADVASVQRDWILRTLGLAAGPLDAGSSSGPRPPQRPMLLRILQLAKEAARPSASYQISESSDSETINSDDDDVITATDPVLRGRHLLPTPTPSRPHTKRHARFLSDSYPAQWRPLSEENKHHRDPPPHPQQPVSSWASSDGRMTSDWLDHIVLETYRLRALISSPLVSSSHVGKHLNRIKALMYDAKIEMLRKYYILHLLEQLKVLTTEVEDIVDEYLCRLLRTQVKNRSSAAEASPVGMQMDKNVEEKLDMKKVIPYGMSGRLKMIGDKLIKASVIWKPRAKRRNYVSSATIKKSKEYELLRAQFLGQATAEKASLKLKGVEKDEAGDAPAVTSAKEGSFDKIVEISSSTSSGITLNRAEETKDKMSKDWEAACHSEEDRKRLLGGCTSDLPPNIQICGRDIDKENIINLLLSDIRSNLLPYEHGQGTNKFFVIPILGVGGVGKTTLAKLVYNDPAVCEHFDARGWVHVSNDTTDLSLSKAITSSITGKSCYGNELNHLQTILHEELIGKRLLLVLDDLHNHNSFPWNLMLALLSGVMLGKIIVTSRGELDDMIVYGSPHYLGGLPLDKSWDLFRQCAFHGLNLEPQDELAEIGMMILCKCKNTPLDVKILGSLLNFRFDKKIWTYVLESEIWETETLPALILSYNLLPSHLKPCFLYCSMFPKGYKFDKYELVRLWMAQDYIESKGNKRMENLGCEYFCELQRMSFFDQSYDGTFTMNDLLYELSKSISKEEFYAIKDSDVGDVDYGVRHLYVADGYQRKKSLSIVKSLALKSLLYQISYGRIPKNLLTSSSMKRLRIPKSLLTSSSMKRLRTLDMKCLEDFTVQDPTHRTDLDEATLTSLNYGDLIHLRYLKICNKYIESLSTSVCKLYHLQTLILDDCSNLRRLPSEIGNLFNLRYLGLSKVNIKMLPESVCQLFNLQSLIVDYCRNLCELPTHIGKLMLLHHLGLSGTNIIGLPESICCLSKVKMLKLDNCTNFSKLPGNVGDLVNLQEIEVTGARIARLPHSVCSLLNLLKLDMAGSDLLELPSGIGNLLKLNYLRLSHTKIDVLPESLCQLSDLHTLKLNGCTNLSHLPSGIGALTSLHHLILSDTDIVELPESLCQLSNLQTLELDGCRRCHSLPSDIGDLINLVHLKLSDTDISELPASFCQLSNLETLELNGCYGLSQLPDNIGGLSNLHELEITETEIRELPKSLCQLGKLKKLKLNGNKNLEEFPCGIENLTNLTHLELCEVGIKELPEHIVKLTKLVKLSFESKCKPTVGLSKHTHAH